MFQAKISRYARDRDGREHRFEKTFSNPEEYRSFVSSNPEYASDRFAAPLRSLFGWRTPFDDLFDTSFAIDDVPPAARAYLPEGVSVDRYEDEARKLEAATRERQRKSDALKAHRERLESYRERFGQAKRDDLLADLERDIAKIDAEITNIGE